MEILDGSSISRIFFCIFLSLQLSYCSLFFWCVQKCMPALKQVKKSCRSHTLMLVLLHTIMQNIIMTGYSYLETNYRKDVLDSAFIARLVMILKTSSPSLQRQAASILEFVTLLDPSMGSIIAVDIESGLDAVFQQKVLKGMGNNFRHSNLHCFKRNWSHPTSVIWFRLIKKKWEDLFFPCSFR